MRATQLLIEEHQYILRALGVIDEMAERVADGESPDEHDVESILHFLQIFGDSHHQEKEEFVLFPALLRASPAEEHESLSQITFEHNQQRSLLEGIEDALRTRKGPDFVYYARRLSELVRAHIKSEEEETFKRVDAVLRPEEDQCVVRDLEAYGSPLQSGKIAAVLERLVALELKYVIPKTIATEKPHYA